MARSAKGASWRYVLNGIASNVTLYTLFVWLVYLELDYRVATTITYVLGILWNYMVNRIWSWQSEAKIAGSFVKYLILYVVVYLSHIGLVVGLVEWLGVTAYIAPLLSIAILLVPQFLILNRFVFK